MAKIAIDLEGKDNASRAFQSASAHLAELRVQIDALRGKGAVNLTVGDARNLTRLTGEANRLEKALQGVGVAGTQSANTVSSSLGRLQGVLSGVGLGGLGAVLGGAGIATAIVGVGKLAFNLSNLREQSEMVEARFRAQVGGAAAATDAYREMERALGNILDRDEKMQAAGQIMGLGLADNARDIAELAKQAAYLGDKTQSVAGRIESLTQILVTGRTMGLREFGISTAEVNARVDELMMSTAGLTDIEAKQIAIKEALASRLRDYIAEGGKAVTTTQELSAAVRTLIDTAADRINIEVVIKGAERVAEAATVAIGPEGERERAYERAFQNYAAAVRDVESAQQGLSQSITPWAKTNAQAMLDAAKASEAEALAILKAAQAAQDAALNSDLYSQSLNTLAGTVAGVTSALSAMQAETQKASAPNLASSAWYGGGSLAFYKSITDSKIAEDKRYADGLAAERARDKALALTAATQSAQAARSAWEAEFRQVSSAIQGYLQEGMSAAKGLMPGGAEGGMFAPGANGPFEPIYRAMAIAEGGIQGPQEEQWAQMYNLTPETAAKIAADFQRGLFTSDVLGLIGVQGEQMLVDYFNGERAADKTMDDFVARLAQRAGVSVGEIAGLFGGAAGPGGAAVTAPAAAAVTNNINLNVAAGAVQVVSSSATQVGNEVIAAIFKALSAAENAIGLPTTQTAPGVR